MEQHQTFSVRLAGAPAAMVHKKGRNMVPVDNARNAPTGNFNSFSGLKTDVSGDENQRRKKRRRAAAEEGVAVKEPADGVKRPCAPGGCAAAEPGVKRGARGDAEVGVTSGRPPAWFFVWFFAAALLVFLCVFVLGWVALH